jgi:VanZ family protein
MFLKHNLYGLLWALVIMILCGIPGRDIPHVSFLELISFDKFVHASIFFLLAILFIRGFSKQHSFSLLQRKPSTLACIICIAYGGILELLQQAVFEERSADIYDFIANSFGVVMGVLLYNRIDKKILSRFKKSG